MSHYLITGAAGFIGSNLVTHLLDQNHQVTAFDNFSTGKYENLLFCNTHSNKSAFRLINDDIRDFKACLKVCKNIDYVLHHAALGSVPKSLLNPLLYNENNVNGTLNILEAAKQNQVKLVVFASSSSVYGELESPKAETSTPQPLSPYAVTKLTGEYYCKLYWTLYKMPTISFRYFNIFGPKQNPHSEYAAIIPKFITSFQKNIPPTIYGDGEQTRDFTYIANVIQANMKACQSQKETYGNVYNIGSNKETTINHLAKLIKNHTKSTVDPRYSQVRLGDIRHSCASMEKSIAELKLDPFIPLIEGLQKTISWFKETNEN